MSKRRKRHRVTGPPPANQPPQIVSSRQQVTLLELDRFSEAQLRIWERASSDIEQLNIELHYGLEKQRHEKKSQLLDALRANRAPALTLTNWCRIVSYQYSLTLLSCAGSTKGYGGRFNVGSDLSDAGFKPWPALYVAENFETAFREKFGLNQNDHDSGLNPEELSLNTQDGWSVGICEAQIGSVFDLGNRASLDAVVKIFARFKMPKAAAEIARRLKVRNLALVRTVEKLCEVVLDRNWRILPSQFELPSHSQILGQLILEAGFEAVAYPSSRNGGRCVAVFPTNFGNSDSYVTLTGNVPAEATITRLDRNTIAECLR